jgi:hypothetical protein
MVRVLFWVEMPSEDRTTREGGRMADDKIVETIKFLLTSVKTLSDRFVESEDRLKGRFEDLSTNVMELRKRLEWLERVLEERKASESSAADGGLLGRMGSAEAPNTERTESSLPIVHGTESFRIPILNLSPEVIVEVYSNTPILLEPFSRACSLTGRTLSGEIDDVELEVFAQGSSWVVECHNGEWLLIPRPGSLERKSSLQSLERLYDIEGVRQLPALLHLIQPARLDAVEVGKRWQLREKGQLSVSPDPLKVGLTERMVALEQRLDGIEGKLSR